MRVLFDSCYRKTTIALLILFVGSIGFLAATPTAFQKALGTSENSLLYGLFNVQPISFTAAPAAPLVTPGLFAPTTTHNVTPVSVDFPSGRSCPAGSTLIGDRFGNVTQNPDGTYSATYIIDGVSVTVNITTLSDNTFNFDVDNGLMARLFVKGGTGGEYLLYQYQPPVSGATNTGAVESDTGLHAAFNASAGTYQDVSHLDFCLIPGAPPPDALSAVKTADGTYDRRVAWTLVKTVDPDSHTDEAGATAGTSEWEVVATKTETLENFTVAGTITVSNTNDFAVPFTVDDFLNDTDDTHPDVTCPGSATPNAGTAPANGSIVCTYDTSVADDSADTNTAVVTPDDSQIGGDTATANVIFAEDNVIGDDQVVVDDDRDTEGQFPDTISESTTYNYDETFTCSSNPSDYTNGTDTDKYPNTATLTGDNTNLSDDAEVTVTCTLDALGVDKTAAGTFDRAITWTLEKSANPTSFSGFAGDVFNPQDLWTVVADKTVTDGSYQVTGSITVTNTAAVAQNFTVDDDLNDGTQATVTCPGSAVPNAGTAPANGSIVCTYTASPAGGTATLNTAVVTAPGNPNQTDTAPVSFTPTVTGDDTTTLADPRFSFSQAISTDRTELFDDTFACPTDLSLYVNDTHMFTVTNIATLTGPNTNLSDSATVTVTCTLRFANETATGFGPQWPGTSNWFMYTPCTTDKVDLIAGQHFDAGDIFIASCPGTLGNTTTITITLHDGFRWANVAANLKIHPMNTAPTKYIQPGKFAYKFTINPVNSTATVTVPKANYYGIHADVRRILLP